MGKLSKSKICGEYIIIDDEKKQEILDLLKNIQKSSLVGSSYSSDKMAIKQLFEKTTEKVEADILLRLTVIDSMYSTQMNRRYYALEDLAKAMFAVRTEKKHSLVYLFTKFAKSPNASLFDYSGGNLFGNRYGIGKDGEEKGIAISLISKYAYFATNYQFPIFDSIVCETLPSLATYLGLQIKKSSFKMRDNTQRVLGAETMVSFVKVINEFISQLSCNISYDALDRLLWFVGKIRRGNLSLVLSKDEYKQYRDYVQNVFDIDKINEETIRSLPFVKPQLVEVFLLAKRLGSLTKYPKKKATSNQ